mmetsp:Transcript_75408/g.245284  ORF Transcript_75408/g.245284 Transcript_75408/m.245284 type:complete len:387 (+) Transcript_75408:4975-6135(+)
MAQQQRQEQAQAAAAEGPEPGGEAVQQLGGHSGRPSRPTLQDAIQLRKQEAEVLRHETVEVRPRRRLVQPLVGQAQVLSVYRLRCSVRQEGQLQAEGKDLSCLGTAACDGVRGAVAALERRERAAEGQQGAGQRNEDPIFKLDGARLVPTALGQPRELAEALLQRERGHGSCQVPAEAGALVGRLRRQVHQQRLQREVRDGQALAQMRHEELRAEEQSQARGGAPQAAIAQDALVEGPQRAPEDRLQAFGKNAKLRQHEAHTTIHRAHLHEDLNHGIHRRVTRPAFVKCAQRLKSRCEFREDLVVVEKLEKSSGARKARTQTHITIRIIENEVRHGIDTHVRHNIRHALQLCHSLRELQSPCQQSGEDDLAPRSQQTKISARLSHQ